MTEDNQNDKGEGSKNIADQIKNALLGINEEYELESEDSSKIFEELSKSDDFEQEIEQILACLNEQTMDLTKLQTQIIILIRKYLGKLPNKNLLRKLDEKSISKNVAEVSSYLMQQHSAIVKKENKGLEQSKDKFQGISKESKANLKRLIKGFAIYQIYMFMNPKRIAGETRKENFAHNMIVGGMKLASKYAGGSKGEIRSYSPKFIKKLENAHAAFKKGGSGKNSGISM